MKKITATFMPQAWQNKYAVEVDPLGEVTWDVTADIIEMGETEARKLELDAYAMDDLRYLPSAPKWMADWSGPFEIYLSMMIDEFFEGGAA